MRSEQRSPIVLKSFMKLVGLARSSSRSNSISFSTVCACTSRVSGLRGVVFVLADTCDYYSLITLEISILKFFWSFLNNGCSWFYLSTKTMNYPSLPFYKGLCEPFMLKVVRRLVSFMAPVIESANSGLGTTVVVFFFTSMSDSVELSLWSAWVILMRWARFVSNRGLLLFGDSWSGGPLISRIAP